MRPSLQIFDRSLFKNSRFYILVAGIILSAGIWYGLVHTITDPHPAQIRLEEVYSVFSLIFIYVAVLASPLTGAFPDLPINNAYLHARRAFGVLGFYFAALHTGISVVDELGGLQGLLHLSNTYTAAVLLGIVALLTLFIMAVTSFDYAVYRLTFPRWKFIHRFVYLAIVAIVIHIILISSHVSGFLAPATEYLILAGILLGTLEAIRLDTKHPNESLSIGKVGPYTWGFVLIVTLFLLSIVTANIQPVPSTPAVEQNHEGHL